MAAACAAPLGAAPARAAPGTALDPSWAAALLQEINDFRVQQGLKPLGASVALDKLAGDHTQDMLQRGYYAHDTPGGPTYAQRVGGALVAEGYRTWIAYENLALLPGQATPDEVFQAWLASPVHRANLLAPDVQLIGLGAAGADGAGGPFGDGPVTLVTAIEGPQQPVLGKSVLGTTVSGTVLVRLPGTRRFVTLGATTLLPTGTELDTVRGRVRIASAADDTGAVQTADFYQGRFVVSYVTLAPTPRSLAQTPPQVVTDLRLSGPLPVCTVRRRTQGADAKKGKERHLWGSGKGSFRTRGRYAAATVRGTVWLVRDDCTGTFVRVDQGVVDVFDTVLRKHVLVAAGQTYLARGRRSR